MIMCDDQSTKIDVEQFAATEHSHSIMKLVGREIICDWNFGENCVNGKGMRVSRENEF